MKKSRPGRSSDFFKVLRSSRSLDVAYSDQKECKTILLKLQLRVQFRTRTGFPFQSIIHERMMNHLWRGQRKSVFSDRTRINEKKWHPIRSFRSIPYCSFGWNRGQCVVIQSFFVERCSSVQGSLEQQSIRSHQRNGCIHPSAIGLRRSDFTARLMAILDYTGSHCACWWIVTVAGR